MPLFSLRRSVPLVVTLLLLLLQLGLFISPALLSIATIALVVVAVFGGRWPVAGGAACLRDPLMVGLTGLYVILVLSWWQTEDWPYYLERLRVKSPLLLLPLAWITLRDLTYSPGLLRLVRLGSLLISAAVLAYVLGDYLLNRPAYDQLLAVGQSIPIPRGSHVRFSMILALSSLLGLHVFVRERDRVAAALAIFIFLGLHVLAVRTGLVLAYAGLLLYLLRIAILGSHYRLLLGAVLAAIVLPVLAYTAVPTLRTKLNYMRYEWMNRDIDGTGKMLNYSDGGRLTSLRLGLTVWTDHPHLGVGYGNMNREMARIYAERLPGVESMRPHNQFVSALVAGGWVGLLWTLACFALIGWGGGRWRGPLYLSVFVMLTLSCLVENTLETSVGVILFTASLLVAAYPLSRKPG
jgi:hypothetical protein